MKENKDYFELTGVHQLDNAFASNLANFSGRKILLNDLQTLSENHAKLIADFPGHIELNGLIHIDSGTAKKLTKHKRILRLNGLKEISNSTAKVFREFEGFLGLNGLETISSDAFEHLLSFKNKLSLNGLKTLPDGFQGIEKPQNRHLKLNGLREITKEGARELAKTGGSLELDGLKNASKKALFNLFMHNGTMSLNSLSTLPSLAAQSIAENRSRVCYEAICLNGITALSEQTAQYLGKAEDIGLNLDGITTMDASIAIHFNEFIGDLNLNGLQEIDQKTAGYLIAKQTGHGLSLGGLRKIDDQVAKVFSNMAAGSLKLGIASLSDQGASYLSKMQGHLSLIQLKEISEKGLQLLSQKHPLHLSAELFDRLPTKCPARWD